MNEVRPCRATGVPPATRIATERARLRPLPIAPEHYALRFPVMVGPTGVVTFAVIGKNGSYAVPTGGLPLTATLVVDAPLAQTGQCGEMHYPGAPNPTCTSTGGGKNVKCK